MPPASAADRPHAACTRRRFSDQLASFVGSAGDERISLATIAELLGHRSISALLLFLALPMALPVPTPGVSVVFGIPLILVSLQLMLRRRRVWLPNRIARQSMRRSDFAALVQHALPLLRRLEAIVRPRVAWMAGDWTLAPVGVVCLALAIIIVLPVPLGHVLPGAAISLLALGLMERDGLVIGIGIGVAVVALGVIALASRGIAMWLAANFG